MSSQLNHAQRHWLEGQQNARAARATLAQIDAIMETKQPTGRRGTQQEELQQPSPRREPLQHRNVQHSPLPVKTPSFVAQLDAVASTSAPAAQSPHRPASTATPSAGGIVPASIASAPTRALRTNTISTTTVIVKKRPVKKPPQVKIEQDLDSALSAAQHLINNFMEKMK
jgi:hypothetical protein